MTVKQLNINNNENNCNTMPVTCLHCYTDSNNYARLFYDFAEIFSFVVLCDYVEMLFHNF